MRISAASKNELATVILNKPYRSGPVLVDLFNDFTEKKDEYFSGFPSRQKYTRNKIDELNGTKQLELLIQEVFHLSHFATILADLQDTATRFNVFLAKDGYTIEITQTSRGICGKLKSTDTDYVEPQKAISELENQESEFLKKEFSDVSFSKLDLPPNLLSILENRLEEASKCLMHNIPLQCVIAIGSILEGLLLNAATQSPSLFGNSTSSPKDKHGKILPFEDWKLSALIDVSHSIGFLKLDVKKHSHSVRDFRNYIHPYEHMISNFTPDIHTAKICFQVLKAAVADLSKER